MEVFRVIFKFYKRCDQPRRRDSSSSRCGNMGCAVRSAEIGFLLSKYLVSNQKVQFRISMDEMEIFERLATLSKSGTGRNQSGWIPSRLEASYMMSEELLCCVAG